MRCGASAPGGPPLRSHDYLLEEEEEDEEESDEYDEMDFEEEVEGKQASSHTVRVSVDLSEEDKNPLHPCDLAPAKLQQTRMSFFLSSLLVMALTLLWLIFI